MDVIILFFKKINLLNWQELEQDLKEGEEEERHQQEESFLDVFFIKLRNIKFNNNVFITLYANNIQTFNFFIKLRFNFLSNLTFLLGQFEKNKYQWTNYNYIPYKFFTRMKSNFIVDSLIKVNKITKHTRLKNIVVFKRKSGFLKKKSKLKNFLLLKLNNLKNYKYLNSFFQKKTPTIFFKKSLNKEILSKSKTQKHSEVGKFLDLKKRWYKTFTNNRFLLKFFTNIKKTKQFQSTRFFSKTLKKTPQSNLLTREFSLLNILIRSKLVFTINEALFFLKNNFVFVNGTCVTNPAHFIKLGDVINLSFCKKYFFFFKTSFNQKLRLTYGVGYRLWRLNRFRNNFYKQSPTGIPEWIFKISFFYEDVVSFLEVDYLTLSLMVIKLPTNFYHYNFYFTKFLSLYLLRLYNWKYVI